MRRPVDAERIRRLMRELGREAETDVRLYFTGGATAVLFGWRSSTIDVDVKLEPDTDRLLRALPRIKEKLEIKRSAFIAREGRLSFYHYDFYAQALAKIERGHSQDRLDVREMLDRGLIDPLELRRRFEQIEPLLYRYPAIDLGAFRRAVDETLREEGLSEPEI